MPSYRPVAHRGVVVHEGPGEDLVEEVGQPAPEGHRVRLLRQKHLEGKRRSISQTIFFLENKLNRYVRGRRGGRGHLRLPAAEGERPVADGGDLQ